MVIWRAVLVVAELMTHDLKRAVCDHLICVHVGCGTCTTLDHVNREFSMVLAGENLLACLRNSLILLVCKKSELVVCHSGAKLGHCQSVDEQWIVRKMETTDREVLDSAKSLYAIEGLCRNLHRTYQIAFDSFHFEKI